MQPETPIGIRERANPRPRPQEPESLGGIDSQEKQGKEKNSAKNQGQHSNENEKLRELDALAQGFDFLLDGGDGHDSGIIVRRGVTAATSNVQNGLAFLFPALRLVAEHLPDIHHHNANSDENRPNHEHQQRANTTTLDVKR